MNNAFSTTGLQTLTVNSTELFQLQPVKNGLPWDLTGGTATLRLADPSGNQSAVAGSIVNGGAQASWTVVNMPGVWTRCWDVTDSLGIRQVTLPQAFGVVSSPV